MFSAAGVVAGAIVTSGEFVRAAQFRLLRSGKVLWEGSALESMRRFNDDANKVAKGLEFGVGIPHPDTQQGDQIVAYTNKLVRKPLTLKI